MGWGVIRMEPTRDPPSVAIRDHVAGRTRPPTAHMRPHLGVAFETIEPDPVEFVEGVLAARLIQSDKRGGKIPNLGESWLFAGGPDCDDVHADESTILPDAPATLAEGRPWTLHDCREFFHETRRLILEACPDAHMVSSLHLDEKAVHAQHEMLAMTRGRVGNQCVREALVRLAPQFAEANAAARERLAAAELAAASRDAAKRAAGQKPRRRRRWSDRGPDAVHLDHHQQMRLIHDLYAARFARFGIRRGPGGKKSYHERVDRAKGMDAKAASIARETAELEARAARARDEATTGEAELTTAGTALDETQKSIEAGERALSEIGRQRRAVSVGLAKFAPWLAPEGKRILDELEASQAVCAGQRIALDEAEPKITGYDQAMLDCATAVSERATAVAERVEAVRTRDQAERTGFAAGFAAGVAQAMNAALALAQRLGSSLPGVFELGLQRGARFASVAPLEELGDPITIGAHVGASPAERAGDAVQASQAPSQAPARSPVPGRDRGE